MSRKRRVVLARLFFTLAILAFITLPCLFLQLTYYWITADVPSISYVNGLWMSLAAVLLWSESKEKFK